MLEDISRPAVAKPSFLHDVDTTFTSRPSAYGGLVSISFPNPHVSPRRHARPGSRTASRDIFMNTLMNGFCAH